MRQDKKGWAHRLQPFIGSLVFIMGFGLAGLVLRRGLDPKSMSQAGMGGMMAAGGIGLVFRASIPRGTAALFVLVAASVGALIVWLAPIR